MRFAAFLVTVLGVLSACAESPAPPPQDAMDGTYANADCPSFTIADGKLRFDDGELSGRVAQGKSGFYFETESALRYVMSLDGCRFVVANQGELYAAERKDFASPVVMIKLFSGDRKQAKYWTRTGPPVALSGDPEK